jgi:hypothetical protein
MIMSYERGVEIGEKVGPVQKLISRMPAEVIAFYTAIIGMIQGIPETVIDAASLYIALTVAFVCGLALTIITAKRDPSIKPIQILLMIITFTLWAWTIGSPLNIIIEYFQLWEGLPGLLLIIWATFMGYL